MRNRHLFGVFAVIWTIFSCTAHHQDTRSYEIGLVSNSSLEEFVKSVREIQLETNTECLISKVDKIYSDSEYLYVLDRTQGVVYVFDHEGTFVSKVARKGRAGNEYATIADMEIFAGNIYILDDVSQKIVKYDHCGTALKTIRLNDRYGHLVVEENRILLYSERSNKQQYDIVAINHDGKIVSQYLPFEVDEGFAFRISPFHRRTDGTYFLTFPYDGRIFTLSDNGCRCELSVTANGYIFPTPEDFEKFSYEELRSSTLYEPALRRITHVSDKNRRIFMIITAFHDEYGLRDTMILLDTESGEYNSYRIGDEISESYPYFTNIASVCEDKIYSSVDYLSLSNINRIIGKESSTASDTGTISNPIVFIYDINW